MATGVQVKIPHMVGIKRMTKIRFKKHMDQTPLYERMSRRRARQREARLRAVDRATGQLPNAPNVPNWLEYKDVSHMFDPLDYLIEMHGRVVGLAISPCHR